jgi:hypothetical protein
LAVAVDVDAWSGAGSEGRTSAWLGSHGWRAVSLGPRDKLPTAWQELGRTSNRRTASSFHAETTEIVR